MAELVRVWIDDEDYGTMNLRIAEQVREANKHLAPDEQVEFETVGEDEPIFTKKPRRE